MTYAWDLQLVYHVNRINHGASMLDKCLQQNGGRRGSGSSFWSGPAAAAETSA